MKLKIVGAVMIVGFLCSVVGLILMISSDTHAALGGWLIGAGLVIGGGLHLVFGRKLENLNDRDPETDEAVRRIMTNAMRDQQTPALSAALQAARNLDVDEAANQKQRNGGGE